MRPCVLAAGDPIDQNRRALRFPPLEPEQRSAAPSATALIFTWLAVALVPVLGGRTVMMVLDEPLLGIVAGVLMLIPLMIAFLPRTSAGGRP